ERPLDVERGRDGSSGGVLVRDRGAEEGDDAVAGELRDGSFVTVDAGDHELDAPLDELVDLLLAEALREGSESLGVGEQRGDRPALALDATALLENLAHEVRRWLDGLCGE